MTVMNALGKLARRVFGSRNERLLRRYRAIAEKAEALEPELRGDYDERFAAKLRELEGQELSPEDRTAAVHAIRKELSRPLAAKAAELKWRLTGPEPFEAIVPDEYRVSDVQRWEHALATGQPLDAVLPPSLKDQASRITEALEQGRALEAVVSAEHLEPPVDRWKAALAAGQPLRAVLPEALRDREDEFRIRMAEPEPPEPYIPLAFALEREASRRAQAHRHFTCQLIGGLVLYEGNVAEMKTGEGKTIVCHLAAFMKVLQGQKVHIVTVNDYLVRRDAEFARPIFDLLGVTVGYIQSNVDPGGHEGIRRRAYACDITYGTNNEFGFDYLRDNMKMRAADQVQGRLDYAIVDEVDSILIDEARTPLIISGPARGDPNEYKAADDYAVHLVAEQRKEVNASRERLANWERNGPPPGAEKNPKFEEAIKRFKVDPYMLTEEEAESIGHRQYFVVQRDRKQAHLTHEGAELAARHSGLGSFYIEENMRWPHLIENALRAQVVYEKDKDYVVQNREVIIVDEFTGRLMHGRQWSDGLHQAVEAKHRNQVEIKRETQTLATITLQNYFKLYKSLAGMTGTAMTESDEFMKIYRLEVVEIPTNRPVNRVDHNDRIYKTTADKYSALVDEIYHVHRRGRPNDPFLVADLLERLLPICREHSPQHVPMIEDALQQYQKADGPSPKLTDALLDAYDAAMGNLATGRPVLVGTTSVENSEKLRAALLKRYLQDFPPKTAKSSECEGLEVLNAKYHEREAEIVAKAGQRYPSRVDGLPIGNVTIATNMAGRGTDIKLEDAVVYSKCKGSLATEPDDPQAARRAWQERHPDGTPRIGTKCCIYCPDYDGKCDHCWKPKLDPRFPAIGRTVCPLNPPCGLHVIGTERHEARRIDNQLRGRSGRQGDPGSSRFFLSLEDDLLKLFMPDWMLKMMERLGFVEGVSLEDRRISKGIERAQKKVEERNFSTRKHLLEWDEPIDYQRKAFYRERQAVLTGRSQEPLARRMIDGIIDEAVGRYLAADYASECVVNWCRESLKLDFESGRVSGLDADEIKSVVREAVLDKARDDVSNNIGEYVDPDEPPTEWDVRGLVRWAATFGLSLTENQLRRMEPAEIERQLLEAAEAHAAEVNVEGVEAYLDPDRGLADLLAWSSRFFDVTVARDELPDDSPATVRKVLTQKIQARYEHRRRVFPIEWIIEEAYARRAGEGAQDARTGHTLVAGWARAKFGVDWTPDWIADTFQGDVQRIGDAIYEQQRLALGNGAAGALEQEIDEALERFRGRPGRLRTWARQRFRNAFDDEVIDEANPDDWRDALLAAGREWLSWEFNRFESGLMLRCYDEAWMDHLLEMDHLKYAIMQRPLGGDQTHPQSQYAIEGRQYFEKMWGRVREAFLGRVLRMRASGDLQGRSIYQAVETRHDDAANLGFAGTPMQAGLQAQGEVRVTETIRRATPRIKPNEPCPCGSGKKYKKCCGRAGIRT